MSVQSNSTYVLYLNWRSIFFEQINNVQIVYCAARGKQIYFASVKSGAREKRG